MRRFLRLINLAEQRHVDTPTHQTRRNGGRSRHPAHIVVRMQQEQLGDRRANQRAVNAG